MTTALAPSSASTILTPADTGWRKARQAWDLAVDQNPAAIARPRSEADVVGAADYARAHGWRVAAQATGHGAAPLGSLAGTIVLPVYLVPALTAVLAVGLAVESHPLSVTAAQTAIRLWARGSIHSRRPGQS
jgi:hypothetical protein